VPAEQVGTATSTNNYFREVGASLGTAVFGALFTARLTTSLTDVFRGAGGSATDAASSAGSIDPATVAKLPGAVQDGIVNAYADSLAPVFWYLLPFIAVAFLLALFLPQITLSDTAGMVARGEAVGGAEADELERAQRAGHTAEPVSSESDGRKAGPRTFAKATVPRRIPAGDCRFPGTDVPRWRRPVASAGRSRPRADWRRGAAPHRASRPPSPTTTAPFTRKRQSSVRSRRASVAEPGQPPTGGGTSSLSQQEPPPGATRPCSRGARAARAAPLPRARCRRASRATGAQRPGRGPRPGARRSSGPAR
jgi:hypothetical protein